MFILESSSHVLEIPNDAFTTLRSKSDWLFNTKSRVLPVEWFILEIKEKATLNTKMPYSLIIVRQDGKRTTTMNNCL